MNVNNMESPKIYFKIIAHWLVDDIDEDEQEIEYPPLKPNAPKEIQEAYQKWIELQKECDRLGVCID